MKEITNKPIPKQYENQYQQMFKEGEALFIVVGDLNGCKIVSTKFIGNTFV